MINQQRIPLSQENIGRRIRVLRKRCGLSVRELAIKSELSPAMISYAERGVTSMSLVTMEKILEALGTSLAHFFAEEGVAGKGPYFAREQMHTVSDADRTYTLLFGGAEGVQLEMSDEHIRPGKERPKFSRLKSDIAGYVLSGRLALEIRGEEPRTLRPGDAFYIPKNTAHRGYAVEDEEAHLITVSPASS